MTNEDGPDALLEPERPGAFERIGIRYIRGLARMEHAEEHNFAPGDAEMGRRVGRVTFFAAAVAFFIGAVSAGGSVYTELVLEDAPMLVKYGWIAGVTAVLTGIEFFVLFWVSLRAVYLIARITGHTRLHLDEKKTGIEITNLLARAALEIPDPVLKILGIDPLARVSRKRLFLIGLAYKAKIVTTNVLAKQLMRRFFGKSLLRVSVLWISVPITGLWNAFTVWKVARDARLRLFGNLLADHLARYELTPEKLNQLSPLAREGCLRAVGNSVVLAQNYHPNMVILLLRLSEILNIKRGSNFDDWDLFLDTMRRVSERERFFLMDLFAVATAFDGKLSRLERREVAAVFAEHTPAYLQRIVALKNAMIAGRLNAAKELCVLDFAAG